MLADNIYKRRYTIPYMDMLCCSSPTQRKKCTLSQSLVMFYWNNEKYTRTTTGGSRSAFQSVLSIIKGMCVRDKCGLHGQVVCINCGLFVPRLFSVNLRVLRFIRLDRGGSNDQRCCQRALIKIVLDLSPISAKSILYLFYSVQ